MDAANTAHLNAAVVLLVASIGFLGACIGAATSSLVQWLLSQRRERHERELSEQELRHQLRLAALDKRLAVHQEAFARWRGLLHAAHDPDGHIFIAECETWWYNNCLYLSPTPREAFRAAYHAAHTHFSLKEDRRNVDAIRDNWAKIKTAGPSFVRAVDLPPIGDEGPQDEPKAI